jgi:hypothetical protein
MRKPPSFGGEGGELSFAIPPKILNIFEQEPRVILKPFPGILLIDLKKARQLELLQKLANDKEFASQFDVVLMPKG